MPHGAAADAGAAHDAVVYAGIGPFIRLDLFRDDEARIAPGYALCGDETPCQAEGAESGSVGDVPLRPVACYDSRDPLVPRVSFAFVHCVSSILFLIDI